jgi:2-succinyl-6-hydroxy-2,4-cyclohexadiene-1-carboxylate synthase
MTLSSHAIGNGSPATFLHGFTQTSRSWSHLVEKLPFTSTLIDLPGHGDSPDGRRSLTQTAEEIADTMPTGCLIGYSMGARMALHTALQHPHKVSALVLISGTAGIRDNAERTARRLSDIELATRIQELGVPAFIDEWLSQPLFAGLNSVTNQRADRLRNHPVGLADSLRFAGTDYACIAHVRNYRHKVSCHRSGNGDDYSQRNLYSDRRCWPHSAPRTTQKVYRRVASFYSN